MHPYTSDIEAALVASFHEAMKGVKRTP